MQLHLVILSPVLTACLCCMFVCRYDTISQRLSSSFFNKCSPPQLYVQLIVWLTFAFFLFLIHFYTHYQPTLFLEPSVAMKTSCKDELNVAPWLTCTRKRVLAALTGACVSSGPSHAPIQQQSGQVQSAIPSASLSLPANSYGGSASASGYSHTAPSSHGSMIQGLGPGYGSSASSSSTSSSSSSSSRSNLNMQSNQGEPGIEEPNQQGLVHC